MSFQHDSTGINPDSFPTLPEKVAFDFKIVEAEEMQSRKGYDMIKLRAEVINDPEWAGTSVFHYVTFIPKGQPGEGISVHFRKSIGVPFGGNDTVDAGDWIGKRFKATTVVEDYQGNKNSKIKSVGPLESGGESDDDPFGSAVKGAMAAQAPVGSDIPF